MGIRSTDWDRVRESSFDLLVAICGYETRATYVSSAVTNAKQVLALDYGSDLHAYRENRRYFESIGAARIDLKANDAGEQFEGILGAIALNVEDEAPVRILFDVSSCSRRTMAEVMIAISNVLSARCDLSCVYALSDFDAPPSGELPSHISEPVVGTLSGWSEDLSKPPCAVIGLGFEPGRALGCIDYLEIPEIRLFLPHGPDVRFQDAVERANALLMSEAGTASVLHYDVMNPSDAFEKLESLLFGLMPTFRPVIIPLGPKIFSAISIALSIQLFPMVCVWRTSAGEDETASDRSASGAVSAFSVTLPRRIT
jgi:hypothetical protein